MNVGGFRRRIVVGVHRRRVAGAGGGRHGASVVVPLGKGVAGTGNRQGGRKDARSVLGRVLGRVVRVPGEVVHLNDALHGQHLPVGVGMVPGVHGKERVVVLRVEIVEGHVVGDVVEGVLELAGDLT
jgi:hypothetical protein